jgi:hypothetical protein
MNNFFLFEPGNNKIGPQIFTKLGVLNSSFIFTKPFSQTQDPQGLLNSVLVQNAGLSNLNGVFNYTTVFQGKPYYNKDEDGNLFILWYEDQWEIYDFSIDFNPIYWSYEDVLYPWHVTVWQTSNPIYNPVPTVTKVL